MKEQQNAAMIHTLCTSLKQWPYCLHVYSLAFISQLDFGATLSYAASYFGPTL